MPSQTPYPKWPGPERREQEPPGWHLDKKVPLSLIFAMLMQACVVVWAIADIKKDVELLKMQASDQRDRDRRQDEQVANAVLLLRSQLERMENKMDRVLERGKQ